MIAIDDRATIGAAFRRAVDAYGPNSFLAVPAGSTRSYHRQAWKSTTRSPAAKSSA